MANNEVSMKRSFIEDLKLKFLASQGQMHIMQRRIREVAKHWEKLKLKMDSEWPENEFWIPNREEFGNSLFMIDMPEWVFESTGNQEDSETEMGDNNIKAYSSDEEMEIKRNEKSAKKLKKKGKKENDIKTKSKDSEVSTSTKTTGKKSQKEEKRSEKSEKNKKSNTEKSIMGPSVRKRTAPNPVLTPKKSGGSSGFTVYENKKSSSDAASGNSSGEKAKTGKVDTVSNQSPNPTVSSPRTTTVSVASEPGTSGINVQCVPLSTPPESHKETDANGAISDNNGDGGGYGSLAAKTSDININGANEGSVTATTAVITETSDIEVGGNISDSSGKTMTIKETHKTSVAYDDGGNKNIAVSEDIDHHVNNVDVGNGSSISGGCGGGGGEEEIQIIGSVDTPKRSAESMLMNNSQIVPSVKINKKKKVRIAGNDPQLTFNFNPMQYFLLSQMLSNSGRILMNPSLQREDTDEN